MKDLNIQIKVSANVGDRVVVKHMGKEKPGRVVGIRISIVEKWIDNPFVNYDVAMMKSTGRGEMVKSFRSILKTF